MNAKLRTKRFSDLTTYYDANPQLAEYTASKELSRMDFVAIVDDLARFSSREDMLLVSWHSTMRRVCARELHTGCGMCVRLFH